MPAASPDIKCASPAFLPGRLLWSVFFDRIYKEALK